MKNVSAFCIIALLTAFTACKSAKVANEPSTPAPEVITVECETKKPHRAKSQKAKDEKNDVLAPAVNDPDRAYVCELQVLVTKFEAYGPTLEEARARVQAQCREKFETMHCADEEDLQCRKTFY